jgi:hypothetical protein
LLADTGRRARPPARWSADDAEQASDRQTGAQAEPWFEMGPCPAVHSDLAPLIALSAANEQSPSHRIEVCFVERECFADPQPSAPEDDNHAAQPDALEIAPGGVHHRDDLLDGWRVRSVPEAFVARRNPLMKWRCCRRRSTPSGAIQQLYGPHRILLSTMVDATIVRPPS